MRNFKKLLYFLVFIFSFSLCEGQSWVWGKQGNFINRSLAIGEGEFVAQDTSHNLFFTGLFSDTLRFGVDTLYDDNHSYTESEIFLVKYDKNGNVLWAKQAMTSGENLVYSIICDKTGNVYLTGGYIAPITFGSTTLLPSFTDKLEMFIVKFDKNGNVIWARNSTSPSAAASAIGFSAALDLNNNVYVTGWFVDTVNFGTTTLTCATKQHSALYVVKYNLAGNVLWARTSINSQPTTRGYSIATDLEGNSIIAGWFYDSLQLGSSHLFSMYGDLFLTKFDSSGNFIWAQQSHTYNNYNSIGDPVPSIYLTTDLASNIYVTGGFDDSVTIGTKTLYCPHGFLSADIFVAKYDYSGNEIWVQQSFSNSVNASWNSYSLSTDNYANLYLSGGTNSPSAAAISFKGDTFHFSSGNDEAIIVKFDSSGNPLCLVGLLTGGDDYNSLTIDQTGNFAFFGGDLDINDSLILGNDTLKANSNTEIPFVARWQPCNNIETSTPPISSPPFLSLFPNPNTGALTIQMKNEDGRMKNVDVYNVLGEKVYSATPTLLPNSMGGASVSYPINISYEPSGIYLYRVMDESGVLVGEGKFVIGSR